MQNHAILHSDLNAFTLPLRQCSIHASGAKPLRSVEVRKTARGDCPRKEMLRLLVRVIIALNVYLNY